MDLGAWLQQNLISLLTLLLTPFLAWYFSRRKQEKEIEKIDIESDSIVVESSQKVVAMWEKMVGERDETIRQLEKRIEALEEQLQKMTQWEQRYLNVMDRYNDMLENYKTLEVKNDKLQRALDYLVKKFEQDHPDLAHEIEAILKG